ncbi:c-type cytochrome [Ramlibacter rhizophilus]|uniref:C-type cytochrome n=1 Tax=Ramlibacter rhizophilus TaxID=1781167 RepID=A0A4Z0BZG1_9BURK|nr:c-type cytochrome [Ramlibacter rhizophilus]TFZ04361.1 c-type cytochrome [Ramlibacter rhizophilus]
MPYRTLAAGLLAAAPLLAAAQDPQTLYVAAVAATCANCHGTAGRPVQGSPLPPLAGMPSEQMLAQLQAFKAGTRPATVMHQISKGFSDTQLQQIAAWFAAQSR